MTNKEIADALDAADKLPLYDRFDELERLRPFVKANVARAERRRFWYRVVSAVLMVGLGIWGIRSYVAKVAWEFKGALGK